MIIRVEINTNGLEELDPNLIALNTTHAPPLLCPDIVLASCRPAPGGVGQAALARPREQRLGPSNDTAIYAARSLVSVRYAA